MHPDQRTDEVADLEVVSKKTDAYIKDVFDWVSCLNQNHLLANLYDFKAAIDKKIIELKS